MKKFALVILAVLATVLLSFGLSWLFHLASRASDLAVVAGLGGAIFLFFLYWEVLKLCVKGFRGEMKEMNQKDDPTSPTKELPS